MRFRHGGNIHHLARLTGKTVDNILDFSANINPLGPPKNLRQVISRNIERLVHYPDPQCSRLVQTISSAYQVSPDQIVPANGSTEIIFALPRALEIHRAIVPVPSYVDYEKAALLSKLEVERVLLQEEIGFNLDWPGLRSILRDKDMVFLGQPNNPTGLPVEPQELSHTANKFPRTLFVVDEAFADFIPELRSAYGLGGSNIIVLKSLTKFYAIPGLRLGFALASAKISELLREQVPPWTVNTLAQAVGVSVLKDSQYAEQTRDFVQKERRKFYSELKAVPGLKVFPGKANYLLVKIESTKLRAPELADLLLDKGIAIRVCDNYQGLDDRFFRLAVRSTEENQLVLKALSECFFDAQRTFSSNSGRKKKTPALMVQGTSSNAGKSILVAALCRIFLQDGIRVAPYKSQNMSLNSFVTRKGGEMGRAQVVQAQACRLDPDIRMNPVLIKPSSDTGSQIIVHGHPVGNMSVNEYVTYKPHAFQKAKQAYQELAEEHDLIILEGAGSPGEVNLKDHDIVNMAMAKYANSPVLICGDIDRGGVFASFIGTMEVLEEWERNLVGGFIVNRFRGQKSLLNSALDYTQDFTGKPVLGVVPYIQDLGLPEEDSVSFKSGLFNRNNPAQDKVEIALIDLPHISNFTDIEPFLLEPDVQLTIVQAPQDLNQPQAVILPGSKNVINDLKYLKEKGLDKEIYRLKNSGYTEIIGICGGFQMLGREIRDPYHLESYQEVIQGLGLLDIGTTLEKDKTLTRREGVHALSGKTVRGYEIHHGQTINPDLPYAVRCNDGGFAGARSEADEVCIWGIYWHGLFDEDEFRRWIIDHLREKKNLSPLQLVQARYDLEPAFDQLAGIVRNNLDMERIYKIIGL